MGKQKRKPKKPVVTNFKVGDEVRVKKGVMDIENPDMPMGGWAAGPEPSRKSTKTAFTTSAGAKRHWLMKKIAKDGGKDTNTSKNHIYTDWDAVDRFVVDFLDRCVESPH